MCVYITLHLHFCLEEYIEGVDLIYSIDSYDKDRCVQAELVACLLDVHHEPIMWLRTMCMYVPTYIACVAIAIASLSCCLLCV